MTHSIYSPDGHDSHPFKRGCHRDKVFFIGEFLLATILLVITDPLEQVCLPSTVLRRR